MAVEVDQSWQATRTAGGSDPATPASRSTASADTAFHDTTVDADTVDEGAPRVSWTRRIRAFLANHAFSSLSRRIAILNLFGLVAMVSAILYLNQFREGLIDARVESLLTQGEIIAGAIAASGTYDPGALTFDPEILLNLGQGQSVAPTEEQLGVIDFLINPEQVAPIMRRLISPTRTRARIYDRDGYLILDSRHIFSRGQILSYTLPPPGGDKPSKLERFVEDVRHWLRRGDLPLYEEIGPDAGLTYAEVEAALSGSAASIVRVNDKNEMIVSVAVPIQRFRAVHGALLLSTEGGDIDAIVAAERWAILRIFLVAAVVTLGLSMLLASTIAGPVHRLAAAAERVRYGTRSRADIPDFSERKDEIGHLSRALHDMTQALYRRIEAIESFAADVAHELKNPLTSLKSAIDTLPRARTPEDRDRLLAIVQKDVDRLNRLITDISDASRLDAELARTDAEPVDIVALLTTVTDVFNEMRRDDQAGITLTIKPAQGKLGSGKSAQGKSGSGRSTADAAAFFVNGHDTRLGQVINNLIDNARSFSPPDSAVRVSAQRIRGEIEIVVEDDGPGIPVENTHRIFERFYTDRGDSAAFGEHSGLGLSISRQIVEAHGGRIFAENRLARSSAESGREEGRILGARFVVRLPAANA